MIDKVVFAERMAFLGDRFNRSLHPGTTRQYYLLLSGELTTAQFVAAADIAFRDCSFWPSPKELIDLVKPPEDLSLAAAQAFEQLLAIGESSQVGTIWRRETIEREFGTPGVKAFRAIGGNERLRGVSVQDLAWCRREFAAAWKAAEQERRLASRAEQAVLQASVELEAAPVEQRLGPSRGPKQIGEIVESVVAGAGSGST